MGVVIWYLLNLSKSLFPYLPNGNMSAFPGGASGKESTCQGRRLGETQVRSLGWEGPLEEGMQPLSYSCHGQRTLAGYSL